jgi:hypothetical protein
MRLLLILFCLALLFTGCKVNITQSDAPITLDSLMNYDYAGLEKMFGAGKLKDSVVIVNNEMLRYTLVMPGTRAFVRLQWTDTTRNTIAFASIFGNSRGASAWKTRDSVTIGITLVELEKINGAPFSFFNDGPAVKPQTEPLGEMEGPIEPGYVMLWFIEANSKSKLGRIHALRLNASIASPRDGSYDSPIFSSNSPQAIANNPIVTEVTLGLNSVPVRLQVETVVFTTNAGSRSNIPRIMAAGRKDPRVDSMNAVILKYFDLKSFDPKKVKKFPWSGMTYEIEMDADVVALHLKGTYIGAYPTEIDQTLFINTYGYLEDEKKIPFHALFGYNQYFAFLDEYWSTGCNIKMSEAEDCAGSEPSCNCFEVKARIVNKQVVLSVMGDCYPHAAAACNPKPDVSVSLEELEPYLSDFGKNIVFDRGYYEKSTLQQHNIEKEVQYEWPPVFFIRLTIDHETANGEWHDEVELSFQLMPDESDPYNGKIVGMISFLGTGESSVLLEGKFAEGGGLELWDPTATFRGRYVLYWVMVDGIKGEGYFEGGAENEQYSFISQLHSNVSAFGERGD